MDKMKNVINSLLIETALNTAHLKTLTIASHELSGHLLSDEKAKNLRSNYYHTLYEKSSELLNQREMFYNQAQAIKALFELHCFVQQQMNDL